MNLKSWRRELKNEFIDIDGNKISIYKNLEEINILDWDTKIKFKNDSKKNNIRKLVVWYHKPKEKTLKTLIEFLYNLENKKDYFTSPKNVY